jgi:putative membrane protein
MTFSEREDDRPNDVTDEMQTDHLAPEEVSRPEPDGGEWHQANWVFVLIGGLRYFRGMLLPLVFVIFTQRGGDSRADFIWYGIAGVAGVVSIGASLIQWWFYRYRVSDRDITLRSGIVSKQERVIPFERIQSVNLEDAPLERIFQVVKVKVDTGAGGGSDSEIELQAMSQADAVALRSQLLAGRQRLRGGEAEAAEVEATAEGVAISPDIASDGDLIRKLSTSELLIAGATSGRVGAAAAIAGVLLQFGEDLVPRRMWEQVPWDGLADAAQQVEVLVGLLLTLAVVAWVISIIATVLTYGGFEIRRQGDQLNVQYGLLDRKRTTIPIRRIQAIRVSEGLLRQPFGFAEIRFDSAGFGADQGASGVLSPLLPKREVQAFLEAACPVFAQDLQPGGMRRLPGRARRRYIVAASIGWVITVLIAAAITWRFLAFPVGIVLAALAVTPVFAWFGNLRYLDAGWAVDGGQFLLRWRAASRVTVLTQVKRLQYRSLRADPFQRRADLVTFTTAVASGGSREGFSLPHLDARDGEQLLERLGSPLPWGAVGERPRKFAPPVDVDFGT